MDFDLCKENIQPLRRGRNPRQLEMALQAQSNDAVHIELMQQKQLHESAIQNYEGEDPLENWFWYIVWIEQSYPKHGHEGNLSNVLEDCLSKFENDCRYVNDLRFCKLWIKYNDMQPNPTELYHMLHARGICKGCAELYRAWAFYYEAAGDYRNADLIFNLGKRELAQPMDELEAAHQSMIFAAGQQVISGVDKQRLLEERQALTTLTTHKSGKVDSVRVAASSGPGILPSSSAAASYKSNVAIPIYEGELSKGAEAAPLSIITAARRQTPKENIMKPGAWSAEGLNWKPTQSHRTPKFKVHEDSFDSSSNGIKLPPDFFPVTHEDHTIWKPLLCYAEPDDPTKIPMYPKARVYTNSEIEFSIEEIRACRYVKRDSRLHISQCETAQAIHSILGDSGSKSKMHQLPQGGVEFYHNPSTSAQNVYQHANYAENNPNLFQQEQERLVYNLDHLDSNKLEQACANVYPPQNPHNSLQYQNNPHLHNPVSLEQRPEHFVNVSQGYQEQMFPLPQTSDINYQAVFQQVAPLPELQKTPTRMFGQHMDEASFHNANFTNPSKGVDNNESHTEFRNNLSLLWRSPNDDSYSETLQEPIRPRVPNFVIYEESNIEEKHIPSKGSAMKSMPLRVLSDEELAETGSRGGHDVAAAAQPGDGAKRNAIFEDDSSSSFLEKPPIADTFLISNLNSTCTTQAFNFNLNAMQVSTPQPKLKERSPSPERENNLEAAKQMLFTTKPPEKAAMPTILEETHRSSSSSSSAVLKSNLFSQSKKETLPSINEDNNYHFNLTQNLKANAALRNSALLELMDYESAQSNPVSEVAVTPLDKVPSNPFKPALLKALLEHIGFPGRHSAGYVYLNTTPRISVRKEVQVVCEDKYIVDKSLGKGTYGQVFRAFDIRNNRTVALKVQKPAHQWEFYICRELQSRLSNHPLKDHFMDIYTGYFSEQISLFISEFSPSGSLLELVNLHKQRNSHPLNQVMVIYFCIEMLKIISTLHQAKIIHGDIKPDNFLVYILSDGVLQLQLIDFGASIDMSLFPPESSFTRRVTTKDFVCCEMLDGRPWNYHTDLFCVAATAHVLLFNNYLQMQKRDGGEWFITQRFTRYMRTDLWNTFFNTLLNQQNGPADPEALIVFLKEALHSFGDKLNEEMRKLINILNNQ